MRRGLLKYLVVAVAVLFILPAGAVAGRQHGPAAGKGAAGQATADATTYVNPSTIPANTTLTVRPPVEIPTNVQPITYTLAHDYATPTQPRIAYYAIDLSTTPWESIVLNYSGTALGIVYDTYAWLSVDNVTVFRSVNPENGYYHVLANLTQYEALFHGRTQMYFSFPDSPVDGQYVTNLTISFYAGQAPSGLPNEIIPVIAASGVNIGNSIPHSYGMTVPANTTAAALQIWFVGNSFDESWYADEPSYRSLEIFSGGHLIENLLPYYKVASGELDLFAWRPLMTPYEINQIPYNVNVTAGLGLLEHNNNISVMIPNVSPLGAFWSLRINELVWTSPSARGASLVSYSNSSSTSMRTDVYMPNAGTSANGGNVSTPEYFVEKVNVNYQFASMIKMTNGTVLVSKNTKETSYMNQYSINLVWENWTAYQLTTSRTVTTYDEQGYHGLFIHDKTSYYPFTADTGFSFTVTQTTNGGFPMYGPFSSYLKGTYIARNVTNTYTNMTGHHVSRAKTSVANTISVENGVFAGVIELTSPVAGVISQITQITGNVTKSFTSFVYRANGGSLTLVSGYEHIIKAVSDNPPGPWYFGTVVLDEIYTF